MTLLSPDEPDVLDDPATQIELDLHSIDGAVDHIRERLRQSPWLAATYCAELTEIAANIHELTADFTLGHGPLASEKVQ